MDNYKCEVPGMLICQIGEGNAYYLISEIQWNSIIDRDFDLRPVATIYTYHMLSGKVYTTEFLKIKLRKWEDLPRNYQLDAIALNEKIRNAYGKDYGHVQNKDQVVDNLERGLNLTVDEAIEVLRRQVLKLGTGIMINSSGAAYEDLSKLSSNSTGFIKDPSRIMVSSICKEQPKNNNFMSVLGNIPGLNLDFGKLSGNRLAISMNGGLAFRTKDGQYVTISEDENGDLQRVEVGSLKMDVDFYTLPTQDLEEGDIVLMDSELLKVVEKDNGGIKFINPLTGNKSTKLPRTNIFGMYFYSKVVSMFDMMGGQGLGLNGLDPMTMMLLSNQEGGDMSQFLILSQLTQGGKEMNPMMMMALMQGQQKEGSSNDLMQFMMMSQAFGGGNPFASKGRAVVEKEETPVKRAYTKRTYKKKPGRPRSK